jgi:hypothetical protein
MKHKLLIDMQIELDNMEIVVNDTLALLQIIDENVPDNVQKTALSAFASQFYNGVENILKRIHKHYNIPLPVGDNWHIQLLQRFSLNSDFEVPIKFSNDLIANLNDLRRFRHYFFHGYSFNIDWDILKASISDIDKLFNSFKETLQISLE